MRLTVDVTLAGSVAHSCRVAALVAASVGYSLLVGGLTLHWKRPALATDGRDVIVLFLSGVMIR